MKLTTLGTGTASPSTRVNAGHLVEAGAVTLLMDCGSGVVHRMGEFGANWLGITHVAFTHFHPDHTLDLTTLIFAWTYGTLPPRSAPLVILGPIGTMQLIEHFSTSRSSSSRVAQTPSTSVWVKAMVAGSGGGPEARVSLFAWKLIQ